MVSTATANAATHIFIVPEGGFQDTAFADVAGEPLNADVTYTIFPQGLNGRIASDAFIDFQYGNSTAPVMTPITVGPTSVSKVVLPSTPTQTNLIINVRSDFGVVVQAVINKRSIVVMPIGPAIGPFGN